ncbi:MAG: tetratricopeptide repeat protein [Chloroflexota bacterium]|nr:tetratricopeptide repeat protein [Chloroflexota bacterium]
MSTERVAQEFVERLSVFTGGFTLESAQAVCADATIHQDDMPSLVSLLVERGLIELDGPSDVSRYRLVPELRSNLSACLMARGQASTVQLRLVEYLSDLAKQGLGHLTNGGLGSYGYEWGIPIGPEGRAWFDRQEHELANLHAAFQWLVDRGDVKRGLALATILIDYWETGPEREADGYAWVTKLLRTHPGAEHMAPSPAERAEGLHLAGGLTRDPELARDHFEEALAIYRQLGHQGQIIHLASHVVNAMCSMRDYPAARALLQDQLMNARAKGKQRLVSRLVDRLAQAAYDEGDLVTARSLFEEALALCQRGGDAALVPHVWLGLARAAGAQPDVDAAVTAYRQALTLLDVDDEMSASNTWPILLGLEGLASVFARSGEVERAGRLFGAADGERERLRMAIPSAGEPVHDHYVLQVRAALHGDGYEVAHAEGRAMSLEQAITYALAGSS